MTCQVSTTVTHPHQAIEKVKKYAAAEQQHYNKTGIKNMESISLSTTGHIIVKPENSSFIMTKFPYTD